MERIIDLLARLVGVVWFGTLGWLAVTIHLIPLFRMDLADPDNLRRIVSLLADLTFLTLLVVLFLVRRTPSRKQPGFLPRLAAFLGMFGLAAFPFLPSSSGTGLVWTAAGLEVAGHVLMLISLLWLGRSFSIFPEARRLITTGPYAVVRHPLYLAEELAVIGMVLNHLSWMAVLVAAVHLAVQIARMGWEEQVLTAAFPEYAAYRVRVKRFLPGIW
jgi:protein-S-isoprenylcysteine O-methyltransferase Ste14